MTEEGLVRKLEALCDAYPRGLRLDRTAGVFQLYKIDTFRRRVHPRRAATLQLGGVRLAA